MARPVQPGGRSRTSPALVAVGTPVSVAPAGVVTNTSEGPVATGRLICPLQAGRAGEVPTAVATVCGADDEGPSGVELSTWQPAVGEVSHTA